MKEKSKGIVITCCTNSHFFIRFTYNSVSPSYVTRKVDRGLRERTLFIIDVLILPLSPWLMFASIGGNRPLAIPCVYRMPFVFPFCTLMFPLIALNSYTRVHTSEGRISKCQRNWHLLRSNIELKIRRARDKLRWLFLLSSFSISFFILFSVFFFFIYIVYIYTQIFSKSYIYFFIKYYFISLTREQN